MNVIVEPEKCCACRACVQVCHKKAIDVVNDIYGYETIRIDESLCVDCGACKKVCPMLNEFKSKVHLECGSAYAKDFDTKYNGSSGGLFGTFAKYMIENNGIVYAAAFDEELHLRTSRADSIEGIQPLLKSKYLLCDTSGVFGSIKSDLDNGKNVLYTSSPCQIAALKGFLKKDYENLICVEFVCHGVGSQKQFYDSLHYIEQKRNIEIKKFSFREKIKKASSQYFYHYCYRDKRSGKVEFKDKRDIYMTFPYYFAYEERLNCRDSCYHCVYATEERVGDITIGDFHSIIKYEPEIDRFAGVSMFVVNTTKGQLFFDQLSDRLNVKLYDWEIIRINNRFNGFEEPPRRRQDYLKLLADNNMDEAVKKFLRYKTDWRWYYYHLPKFVRNAGNKLLRRSE